MVVSARRSLKIGVEIMKKGGNAFDAMVATNWHLQLPILMQKSWRWFYGLQKANGEIGTLDYREKAPYWLQKTCSMIKKVTSSQGKDKTPLAIGIPEPLQEFCSS
jgi:gamma-glutamyltranspeptidase/glutathione hydrolase